jgi:hypothetical protein
MSKPSKYSQATKEQRSLMDKEYEQNRKKGAKEFVSSVTGQKLAITENQKNWKKGEFQLNRQLEENQKRGKFNKDYLIVDDVNSTVHKVSKDHKVQRSIPAVTGKNKGEHVPESAKSWVGKNPGKTFNDYIDHLDKTNQKITPSGEFEINGKRRDPSAPKSKSEKLKYALYKSGAQKLAQTVIANKPELFNLPGASTVFNDWDVRRQRYEKYGDGMLTLKDSKTGQGIGTAIHGTNTTKRLDALNNPDATQRKLSASCINLPNGDIVDLRTNMKVGAKVQMMPEDSTKVINAPNLSNIKPVSTLSKIQQPINNTVAESTGFNNYIPKFEKGTQSIKFNNNMKNKSKKYSGGTDEVKLSAEDRLSAMGKKRAKPRHSAYKDASSIKSGATGVLNGNSGYVAPEKDVRDISSYVSGAGMGKSKKLVATAKTYEEGTSGIKAKVKGMFKKKNTEKYSESKAKEYKGSAESLKGSGDPNDDYFVGPVNKPRVEAPKVDTKVKFDIKKGETKANVYDGLANGGTMAVAKYQEKLNKEVGSKLKLDGAWGDKTNAAYNKSKEVKVTGEEIGLKKKPATGLRDAFNAGIGVEQRKPKVNTKSGRTNEEIRAAQNEWMNNTDKSYAKMARSGNRYGDAGEQMATLAEHVSDQTASQKQRGEKADYTKTLAMVGTGLAASYGATRMMRGKAPKVGNKASNNAITPSQYQTRDNKQLAQNASKSTSGTNANQKALPPASSSSTRQASNIAGSPIPNNSGNDVKVLTSGKTRAPRVPVTKSDRVINLSEKVASNQPKLVNSAAKRDVKMLGEAPKVESKAITPPQTARGNATHYMPERASEQKLIGSTRDRIKSLSARISTKQKQAANASRTKNAEIKESTRRNPMTKKQKKAVKN